MDLQPVENQRLAETRTADFREAYVRRSSDEKFHVGREKRNPPKRRVRKRTRSPRVFARVKNKESAYHVYGSKGWRGRPPLHVNHAALPFPGSRAPRRDTLPRPVGDYRSGLKKAPLSARNYKVVDSRYERNRDFGFRPDETLLLRTCREAEAKGEICTIAD